MSPGQKTTFARMGYSFTPVNGSGLRRILANPVGNVLYFAGEATNVERAATVHVTLESGYRAAPEVEANR